MNLTKEEKINFLVVPISILVIGIVTMILVFTNQNWKYYLIGGALGLLTHGLMVKQNARMTRMVKLDPEHTTFNPKRSSILWYFLRFGVVAVVLVVLGFLIKDKEQTEKVISMILALAGYATLKIIFLICILIFREKVIKE